MFKILVVDDEEHIHVLIEEKLQEAFPDCEIMGAYSGEEALTVLHEYAPDIILLDIKMPGMNGVEVLQRIKFTHPHVHVFFLTAYDTFKWDFSTWHADDYIIKSFDISELIDKIDFCIKNGRTKHRIYQESFPFPIAYNIVSLRSKINAKELLDHLFGLTEYMIKYFVCILLSQCLKMNEQDLSSILGKYKHQNMTMGKWYGLMISLAKVNRKNDSPFIPELSSIFFSSSGKVSTEISSFEGIIKIRNAVHKRPFSERSSENKAGDVKITLWGILDKCIFLKDYLLQVVEAVIPNPKHNNFLYHIKNLMGSHPEFLLTTIEETQIYPFRELFLRRPHSSEYLNLTPYIIFDFCPQSQRDDIFLFDKIGDQTIYKSSQQGHHMNKDECFFS